MDKKTSTASGQSASSGGADHKPAARATRKPEDTYTDPALRERLKAQIMAGDKGGDAGQWSARKSQLLASEYKKAGGGYKNRKPTAGQEHLREWAEQEWQTSDGKPAKRASGTTRYLPKEAWEKLTPSEKKATNNKKKAASKAGQHTVPNTAKAKQARKQATD
jgi:hypothetical protein